MAKPKAQQQKRQRSDGWTNIYTALGSTTRDKRTGSIHATSALTEADCEDIWRGDDIAARVVEAPPKAMLRQGFEVLVSDASPGEKPESPVRVDAPPPPPFPPPAPKPTAKPLDLSGRDAGGNEMSDAVEKACEKLDTATTFMRAIATARGLGGSAILVGADDGQKYSEPLDETHIKSVKWLKVLRPREALPLTYYQDVTSEKFGEVKTYRVQRDTLGGGVTGTLEVHESRLIKFFGVVVTTRQRQLQHSWGDSVLVRCIEKIRDFQAAYASAGVLMQDFAQAVFKMAGLAELMMNGDDDIAVKRAQSIDLSRSVARAILIDKDEEFERKSTPVTGMPDLLDRMANRLAAATEMPVTILMGQAPAGLNATGASDIRAWYDALAGERERDVRPKLQQLVRLVMLAKDGPTKGVEPKSWSLKFPSLWQPTESETADTRLKVAQTDHLYITDGVLLPEEVAVARFGGDEWSMETQLDDEARQASAEADAEAAKQQAELAVQGQGQLPPGQGRQAGGAPGARATGDADDDEEGVPDSEIVPAGEEGSGGIDIGGDSHFNIHPDAIKEWQPERTKSWAEIQADIAAGR